MGANGSRRPEGSYERGVTDSEGGPAPPTQTGDSPTDAAAAGEGACLPTSVTAGALTESCLIGPICFITAIRSALAHTGSPSMISAAIPTTLAPVAIFVIALRLHSPMTTVIPDDTVLPLLTALELQLARRQRPC